MEAARQRLGEARTVSVRLDPQAGRRLDKAAALLHQSRAAFLERAGDDAARRVLTDWAARRYRQGGGSFSELAEETGLAVEEIVDHPPRIERGVTTLEDRPGLGAALLPDVAQRRPAGTFTSTR